MCISPIGIKNRFDHLKDELMSNIFRISCTCDGVCIRVLAGPGEAGVGLGLLPLFPAPNAVAAPRASCAPQGAARISESKSRVPPDPDLVLLVVENNIAERQENFGRTTSFRRRRRLERHYLDYDHLSQKYL